MFSDISSLFTNSMMHLLDLLKSLTGSYGWAIVIFAGLVKVALYYPTQSQYKSMKEMQKIQPMLKKLQEKYKNDPQRFNQEQMALFKKYNVNPLGGCLPILIQMPILIGIFVTIRKMAELGKFAGETFLWIGGPLSKMYPNWIGESLAHKDLPLLLIYAISMYLSQKMSVSTGQVDQTQKMMSIMMPVLFAFILWKFPSSLILYWLVFNILSIIQQYIIMRDSGDTEEIVEEIVKEEKESPSGRKRSRSRKKKGGK